MKNKILLVVRIILLGVLVASYFVNLTGDLTPDDEGVYLYTSWRMSLGETVYRDFFEPQMPLAHLFTAWWFKLFRYTDVFIARVQIVVITLLIVLLVVLLGKQIFTLPVGLTAGIIYLSIPNVYSMSRIYTPEQYMVFFSVLGTLLFIYFYPSGKNRWRLVLPGVCFAISSWCKLYGGILHLVAVTVFMGIEIWNKDRQTRKIYEGKFVYLLTGFIITNLLLFIWISPVFTDFFTCIYSYSVATRTLNTWRDIVWIVLDFTKQNTGFVLLFLGGIIYLVKQKDEINRTFTRVLLMVLLTPLCIIVLSSFNFEKHLVMLTPYLSLVAAKFFISSWRENELTRIYAGLSLAIMLFINGWVNFHSLRVTETDTLSLAQYIKERTQPWDYIVADYTNLNFYSRRRCPPRLTDLSAARTGTGAITTDDIIYDIERYKVKLVLIHTENGAHHFISSPRYDTFYNYVKQYFTFDRYYMRAGQQWEIYLRK